MAVHLRGKGIRFVEDLWWTQILSTLEALFIGFSSVIMHPLGKAAH